jgi:DNA-binding MarR family transcriptional regulator
MKYFIFLIKLSLICQYNLPIMKKLLYLKDDQIKEFIEKIFMAYRESFSDSKKTLDKYSIGIAHHKVVHLLSIYKGITITELLKKLKITKQSLNRVLKDLINLNAINFEKDKKDTRLKHIYLSNDGEKIFNEIFLAQKKRIYKALLNSTSEEVLFFNNVIKKIIYE